MSQTGGASDSLELEKDTAALSGRAIVIPLGTFATGFLFGVRRGTRMSSLQYLAENAHRAPRTMEGWYFYSRTKNYRVMWGGMKEGFRGGMRLAGVGLLWVGLETVCRQTAALDDVRELVAGGGSGLLVAMLGDVGRVGRWRIVGLGLTAGALLGGVRSTVASAKRYSETPANGPQ